MAQKRPFHFHLDHSTEHESAEVHVLFVSIADAHGKTSAQIILRWHLQAGNIAIPGSSNEDHIAENFDIFDFALTDDEMAALTALDRNERFVDY